MPISKLGYYENNKTGKLSNANGHSVEILTDDELNSFEKFIDIPMILFNEKEVLYLNDFCKKMLGYEELLKGKTLDIFDSFEKEFIENTHHILEDGTYHIMYETSILNKDKEKLWVELIGRTVIYNSQKCIFASLKDISDVKQFKSNLSRISKVRALMLETTRFALKIEDISELFQLILRNALYSIENGTIGTILIKKGDYFTVASQMGFSGDIKDFKLPIEDAFLYRATNGRMDEIVNIPDLVHYRKYYPIETKHGEKKYIKSTLTAPIYINGSLFGMINIDSIETNAFDGEDVKSMEFIRNYIEIIITNYLLYEEKSHLARYDQLTNVCNRSYFEEQVKSIIDKALCYKETFNLVIWDINNLKAINDSFGHLTGDEVIKKFIYELKNNIRKTDIIGRYGGDEFVGVFLNSHIESLDKKFQNLLTYMENNPLCINGKEIICGFSYGIASFPKEGIHLKDLIRVADERMYIFKKNYKKRIGKL